MDVAVRACTAVHSGMLVAQSGFIGLWERDRVAERLQFASRRGSIDEGVERVTEEQIAMCRT